MGNTELMKRKRAEQVRGVTGEKKRAERTRIMRADGEVCSSPDQERKKTLVMAGVVRDTALIRTWGL